MRYEIDTSKKLPIRFFVRGDNASSGDWESDLHPGTDEGRMTCYNMFRRTFS